MTEVKQETGKFTRKQYMNHECTHREYYGQYVEPWVKSQVLLRIPLEKLRASKDEHLNDIPLRRWDAMPFNSFSISQAMKGNGDYLTQAGIVCIAKEAARQIMEDLAE